MTAGVAAGTSRGARASVSARSSLLAWAAPHVRPALWGVVVALTVALLLSPTRLVLEYSPVQSPSTIPDMPRFAATYYLWLAGVLALLATIRGERRHSNWEALGLVALFGIVFLGFYLFHEPYPGVRAEGPKQLALAGIIRDEGVLFPDPPIQLPLREWPGLGLLLAQLGLVSGQPGHEAAAMLLVLYAVLLPVLLYQLFDAMLGMRRMAAFGAMLLVQGDFIVNLAQGVQGYYFGPLWLTAFLLVLNRGRESRWSTGADRLTGLILLTVTTITHLLSALLFAFTMVGIGVAKWLRAGKSTHLQSVPLYIVVPAVWLMYWAVLTFNDAVMNASQFIDKAVAGETFAYLGILARVNVGSGSGGGPPLPAWVGLVRLLWLVLILVPGALAALWLVLRWTRRTQAEQELVGQFAGVTAFDGATGLISKGGEYLVRLLWHAPLFTVPLALGVLGGMRRHRVRFALAGALVAVFFVTSLPTFFAHHPTENTDTVQPSEFRVGAFLERNYGQGQDLHVVSGVNLYITTLAYWVPRATVQFDDYRTFLEGDDALWEEWDSIIRSFLAHDVGVSTELFFWSPRITWPYEHQAGIRPDHPNWLGLQARLASATNVIYDDGTTRIYQN